MSKLLLSVAVLALAIPTAASAAPTRFSVITVGTGPDVILIPGLSSPRAVWTATADQFPIVGSYHFIMQDQPARFAAELETFLKR